MSPFSCRLIGVSTPAIAMDEQQWDQEWAPRRFTFRYCAPWKMEEKSILWRTFGRNLALEYQCLSPTRKKTQKYANLKDNSWGLTSKFYGSVTDASAWAASLCQLEWELLEPGARILDGACMCHVHCSPVSDNVLFGEWLALNSRVSVFWISIF